MFKNYLILIAIVASILMTTNASRSDTEIVALQCPKPTPDILKCLGRYACEHAIRLDLNCLLNVNGTPLLGGLLGGGSGGLLGSLTGPGGLLGGLTGGLTGGGAGAPKPGGAGGAGGVVGSLLGR